MMAATKTLPHIPEETSQAARRLYNLQYIYLRIGDQLESLLSRTNVQRFSPDSMLDGITSFRLALASAFQLAEALPDALAADATLRRMDWKYALFLPVRHPGISEAALCEFRQGMFSSPRALTEFGNLLEKLNEFGLYASSSNPALHPGSALNTICQFSRLYNLQLTMKTALGMLVSEAPDWLLRHVSPYWYERYAARKLPACLPSGEEVEAEAARLGGDIAHLLDALRMENMHALTGRDEIVNLERLFRNSYSPQADILQWCIPECPTCVHDHRTRGGLP